MILICIPVARRTIKAGQHRRILELRDSLVRSLARISRSRLDYQVRLVLNGPPVPNDFANELTNAFSSSATLSAEVPVNVMTSERLGKIACVNSAIRDPNATGIVVVDDDVSVPPEAFPEIDRFLSARRQHLDALCFAKAPVYPNNSSTVFAAQLSFLLHPSTQRLLVKMGFFRPYRPASGSLYAIHRDHFKAFPDPCNEADVFATRRVKMSCHFVRTWYPVSFDEEVTRRAAHIQTRYGFLNSAKSLETVTAYDNFTAASDLGLPSEICLRIHQALGTMKSVIVAAESEVIHAEHS